MEIIGNNSVKGTKAKSNLYMKPIEDWHLADLEWEVLVFTDTGFKSYIVKKEDCKKQDDDNYLVPVDTAILGAGVYYGTVALKIPDGDFPDGIRIERRTGMMDIVIDPR